ncbi:MAG: Gx transporter family protein [Synergistaceae bacterium]|jgi:heptaprenyl diphosphate synthase|nr:Gx transporter family protein [Synergistaceae bacterium]
MESANPMTPSTRSRTEKTALLALFSALALAVGAVESWFPLPFPGVRLGLANVFPLLSLLLFGPGEAVAVALVRLCLAFLLAGNPFALACSAGGLSFSLPLSILLYKKYRDELSVPAISVASAAAFNAGQMGVVVILTSEPSVLTYLPVIMTVGCVTGFIVGCLADELLRRIESAVVRRFP